MKRLGRVLHVSSSKNLILKAEKLPRINDKVVDENLKPVGTVFDVFGPVSSPYVAVKPSLEEPQRFVNRVLYVFPSLKRKWKKRK
ncbi:MAG: H/ACA ribonucleoprotein complex subunit GAR1 [Candidatus Bathyarchaeia archaeon]